MKILTAPFDLELPFAGRGRWRNLPDWTGLWEKLAEEGPAVLLESGGPVTPAGRWNLLAGGRSVEFFGKGERAWFDGRPAPFGFGEFIDRVGRPEEPSRPFPFGLAGAWFGALAYGFADETGVRQGPHGGSETPGGKSGPRKTGSFPRRGKRPSFPEPPVPDFYFFKPPFAMAFHRGTREYFLFGEAPPDLFKAVGGRKPFRVGKLRAQSSRFHYESMVRRAKDYISRGDIYQANLSQSFQAAWKGNPAGLYRVLREVNPGPFMGILKGRGFTVVSSSPERLAAGEGRRLEARPIAGTRPRFRGKARDLESRRELRRSPKERSEHLMLVDLARNDLGRISLYGTVKVRGFAEVESYSKVHHLVSRVESARRPDARLSQVLRALFPGGTITGCPKVRCMQVIGELEKRRRGFYTGSMGYVAPGPRFDFNILIRSFTLLDGGKLEFCAGAGIVADSDPRREYLETLYKAEALAQALGTSLVPDP